MIISDYLGMSLDTRDDERMFDNLCCCCATSQTSNIKERACVRLSVNIIQVSQVFLPPVQCYSPAIASRATTADLQCHKHLTNRPHCSKSRPGIRWSVKIETIMREGFTNNTTLFSRCQEKGGEERNV